MGTRGKVKALTALGAARSQNKARILKGEKPKIEGKPVSAKTFAKKTGETVGEIKKAATQAAGSPAKAKAEASKQAAKSKRGAKKAAAMVHGKPSAKVRPGAFKPPK